MTFAREYRRWVEDLGREPTESEVVVWIEEHKTTPAAPPDDGTRVAFGGQAGGAVGMLKKLGIEEPPAPPSPEEAAQWVKDQEALPPTPSSPSTTDTPAPSASPPSTTTAPRYTQGETEDARWTKVDTSRAVWWYERTGQFGAAVLQLLAIHTRFDGSGIADISSSEIAALLGRSKSSITDTYRRLKDAGVIQIEGRRIIVLSPPCD